MLWQVLVRRLAGPDVVNAVFEPHKVARGLLTAGVRQKSGLDSAQTGFALGDLAKHTHGVEDHLRVVGTGLHRQVTAASRWVELVAVEKWEVSQCVGQTLREAVLVFVIFGEQAATEAECQRQALGRHSVCRATVDGGHREVGGVLVCGGLAEA